MDALSLAIAAGLSLGIVAGIRGGRGIVLRVGGPFAKKPLVLGVSIAAGIFFMIPASLFAVFISRNFARSPGGSVIVAQSTGALVGIAAGNALVIASGLMLGVFAGALSARLIEEIRAHR